MRRQNAQRLRQIEAQLVAIDAALEALIQEDKGLQHRRRILLSIPGISAVTAVAILVEMPELGTLDQKQAANLAGLAPVTRQSGSWQGRALSAAGAHICVRRSTCPPWWRLASTLISFPAVVRRVNTALPAKVAITAVMRKLLVLANALLRDGREWSPERPRSRRIL